MIASEAQPFQKRVDWRMSPGRCRRRWVISVTMSRWSPRYRGVTDGPIVGTVSIEVAAHRFVARLMDARQAKTSRTLVARLP